MCLGVQGFRGSGVQGFRGSGVQGFRAQSAQGHRRAKKKKKAQRKIGAKIDSFSGGEGVQI